VKARDENGSRPARPPAQPPQEPPLPPPLFPPAQFAQPPAPEGFGTKLKRFIKKCWTTILRENGNHERPA
jgi:hypothetical protein